MKKLILTGLAACSFLLLLSCSKKESLAGIKTVVTANSKLKVNDVYIGGAVPSGTYKFTTGATINASNKTMGVSATLAVAAPVKQLDYVVNTGSDWRVTDLGNGYYSIINTFSNQALTLGDASVPEHLQIIQYGYGGIDAQQWKIEYQGAFGVYRLKCKLNLNKGAHVDPYSTASGTPIKVETYPTADASAGYFFLSLVSVPYQDAVATQFFQRQTGWDAGDGSCSVKLTNGKVLWMMDDSNIGTFDLVYGTGTMTCNQAMVNNAGLLQPFNNWSWAGTSTLLGSGSSSYVKSQPGTSNYNWVSSGFQLGDIVYWKSSTLNGSSDIGLDVFAKYQVSTNSIIGYSALPNTVSSGIRFGYGFSVESDGYVYAFGAKTTFIVANVYVARFPQSNPTGPWTYWNGSAWVSDVTQSAVIGESADPVPFVSKVANKYVIVSTELSVDCGNGKRIYTSTANTPTGPFSTRKEIYQIPDQYNNLAARFYWGMAHPEYINSNNELLITYNVNSDAPSCGVVCSSGREDPNRYRPRAIRVPLTWIDPTF